MAGVPHQVWQKLVEIDEIVVKKLKPIIYVL
jgi:hypothetical protein